MEEKDREYYKAIRYGSVQDLKKLLGGSDRSCSEITPYHRALPIHAAAYGNVEALVYLLDQGCTPNARDESGNTALTLAVAEGNVEMVKLLLAKGADANVHDDKENTPLAVAITRQSSKPELVELLMAAGADPDWENRYGQSAISLAKQFNLVETLSLLSPNKE